MSVELRKVPLLLLMMEAHSCRLLKSTNLSIHPKALVEVHAEKVELEKGEEEWLVTFKVHTGPG